MDLALATLLVSLGSRGGRGTYATFQAEVAYHFMRMTGYSRDQMQGALAQRAARLVACHDDLVQMGYVGAGKPAMIASMIMGRVGA